MSAATTCLGILEQEGQMLDPLGLDAISEISGIESRMKSDVETPIINALLNSDSHRQEAVVLEITRIMRGFACDRFRVEAERYNVRHTKYQQWLESLRDRVYSLVVPPWPFHPVFSRFDFAELGRSEEYQKQIGEVLDDELAEWKAKAPLCPTGASYRTSGIEPGAQFDKLAKECARALPIRISKLHSELSVSASSLWAMRRAKTEKFSAENFQRVVNKIRILMEKARAQSQ
jgi:hypothetical protein